MRKGPARNLESVQRASALARAGDVAQALEVLETARALDPCNTDVLLALARLARRLSMPEAALKCSAAALVAEPQRVDILVEHSVDLRSLQRHGEACALLRSRVEQEPNRAELWLALANTVREQGLLAEAETFLREALRLNPKSVEAAGNLADLLFDRGETEEARALYDAAVKRAPKHAQLRLNRALALLHAGETQAGWREYEWRLEIEDRRIERRFEGTPPLRWDGSERNGKPLLIAAEQGLGDQILFASVIPHLLDSGDGSILIECEPRLVPLFARSFSPAHVHGYLAVFQGGMRRIDYDWLPESVRLMIEIGSLPKVLRLGRDALPATHVPLIADAEEAEHWRRWLLSLGQGPKIGICWRSGKRGSLRDIQYAPLDQWAAFLKELRACFIMCQYDHGEDEIAALRSAGISIHIPPGLDQKSEIDRTAALFANLDAMVSAPTAVAALAAAVGTPTIKLTHAGSWTALGTLREPFLPAGCVIRPARVGDWADAFARARASLEPHLRP